MISTHLRAALIAALASLTFFACGSGDTVCTKDEQCGSGSRCEEIKKGDPHICVKCDSMEVRYDGLDNDCNPRTLDSDIDRDGDNWIGADVDPGGDCDDNDSLVSSKVPEICNDQKDNDCDTIVDELDCGDRALPQVSITSPAMNAFVSDTVTFAVTASDDVGISRLRLLQRDMNGGEVERDNKTIDRNPNITTTLTFDTRLGPDGANVFIVEAYDISNKTSRAMITLNVDNVSPPTISPGSPAAGRSYDGSMSIVVATQDASHVASLEILLDGTRLRLVQGTGTTTLSAGLSISTSTLAEGAHTVRFNATDGRNISGFVEVPFKVDHTPPTVSIASPMEGAMVMNQVMFEVNASDNIAVASLTIADQMIEPNMASVMHTFDVDSLVFPNGRVQVVAEAKDGTIIDGLDEGGHSASAYVHIVVNNVRPEVYATVTPDDGAFISGYTMIHSSIPATQAGGLSNLTITVDGKVIADYGNTANGQELSEVTRFWDFSDAVGPHTIEVTATKATGERGTSTSHVLAVQPPVYRGVPPILTVDNVGFDPLAMGDVTGDGIPDFVGPDSTAGVAIYEGEISSRGWRLGKSIRIPGHRGEMIVADMNDDGRPEIFSIDRANLMMRVYALVGMNWVEGSSPYPMQARNSLPALGDFDGDGLTDVVITGLSATHDLDVFQNAGNGLSLMGSYGPGTTDAWAIPVVADVDDDDDEDIVVCGNVVRVFLNDGTGVFADPIDTMVAFTQETPQCMIADVTGDGFPDLVKTEPNNRAAGPIAIYSGDEMNVGTYTFVRQTRVDAKSFDLVDLDLNSSLDIVASGDWATSVAFNDGNGNFNIGVEFPGIVDPRIRAIDVDNDGDKDIVSGAIGSIHGGLSSGHVIINQGLGTFIGPQVTHLSSLGMAPGDAPPTYLLIKAGELIGNSLPDVAYVDRNLSLVVLENTGGGFTHTALIGTGASTDPQNILIGQVDGVNGNDILLGSFGLYLNDGPGAWSFHITSPSGNGYSDVRLGDVNNNGLEDLVYCTVTPNAHAGVVEWDASMGVVHDLDSFAFPVTSSPRVVAIGDLTADATPDFAVLDQSGSKISMYSWNGTRFDLLNPVPFTGAMQTGGFTIQKLGIDPYPDLVMLNGDGLYAAFGMQMGGFAAPAKLISVVQGQSFQWSDFNGDGNPDMVLKTRGILYGDDQIYIGDEVGSLAPTSLRIPNGFNGSDTADFNGDGKLDFVTAYEDYLTVFINETP